MSAQPSNLDTLSTPARIVVVGDAMMDVSARIASDIVYASDTPAKITQQPGGSGANTAAWLAALGTPVRYVGAVGADPFGEAILHDLREVGVDCHVHVADNAATGTCIVVVDGSGERTMFPDAGANSRLTPEMVMDAIDETVAHVHVSGYTLLNPASRAAGLAALDAAEAHGCTISLDPASVGPLEQHREVIVEQLPRVNVILANAAEAAVLVGTDDPHNAVAVLLEVSPVVVIKLGPRGALAATLGEQLERAAIAVPVLDSTGAGDAFSAGFLPAWLAGRDLQSALDAGLSAGATAVSRVGAGPPRP